MDDTIADYKPLLIRPIDRAPMATLSEAAKFGAISEEHARKRHLQYKGAIIRFLIHPRTQAGAGGKTSPLLLGLDDRAVGDALLFPLFDDLGIRDGEIAGHVSRAGYFWDEQVNPRPAYIPQHASPIIAALIGTLNGAYWVFRLQTFNDGTTRRVMAAVYDIDAPPPEPHTHLPPSFLPGMALTVALPRALLPLAALIQPVTAH